MKNVLSIIKWISITENIKWIKIWTCISSWKVGFKIHYIVKIALIINYKCEDFTPIMRSVETVRSIIAFIKMLRDMK